MLIPRLENGTFIPEWHYVNDNFISSIWDEITSPYIKFFERYIGPLTKSLYKLPLTELGTDESLSEYCEEANTISKNVDMCENILLDIPYVKNSSKYQFRVPFMVGEKHFNSEITLYLTHLFSQRFDIIFSHRLRNGYPTFVCITNIPEVVVDSDIANFLSTIVKSTEVTKMTHVTFSKNIVKRENSEERLFRDICKDVGNSITRSILKPSTIEENINGIIRLSKNNCRPIRFPFNHPSPTTLALTRPICRSMFRTVVYQNGVLVEEKRGRFVPYAYLEMQWKLIQRIDESNPNDQWVIVNGLLNYIE